MAMCAIGRELRKRGHQFLLLGTEFQAKQLRLSDIPFQILGRGRKDPVQRYFERVLQAGGVPLSASIEYMKAMADLLCAEAPYVFRQREIDFVLADQEEPGAATAADLAGVPYASICTSLPLNAAPDVPPGFLGWSYSSGLWAQARNQFGYAVRNAAIRGLNSVLNVYRRGANLRLYWKPEDSFSRLAQITQLVNEFDFPRRSPVPAFHYVGPFHRQDLSTVAFPYDRLNGRPLVYASFGTAFGGRLRDMRVIAEACALLPVQLVIALGGSTVATEHQTFPGNPVVVSYAPQHELLSRAALAITHAGLNTTLEALRLGVPLLAMPIAGDQPGVAARIVFHGAGQRLAPEQRDANRIRNAVSSLLEDPRWRTASEYLRDAISRSGGAVEAAEIVEAAAARCGAVNPQRMVT